jgi:hypothetical protein
LTAGVVKRKNMENMDKGVEKMKLTAEIVQELVERVGFRFEIPASGVGPITRCIDDRDNQPVDEFPVAFPGSSAGIIVAALAAGRALEKEGKFRAMSPSQMAKIAEKVLGGSTIHTDEKGEHDPCACAGCGHIMLALRNPKVYGLTEADVRFLKEEYIPSVAETYKKKGEKPEVYEGSHAAHGVVIIDDEKLGLPAQSGGTQVYVFNRALQRKVLGEIAKEIAASHPNISEKDAVKVMNEAADKQTGATVEHLAKDLPKFRVFQEGDKVRVEEL